MGKHDLRDAERRLAAELPGDSRARVPARHPSADAVAGRGPRLVVGSRAPPSYDAHPDDGASRWSAGAGLRLSWWRSARAVAVDLPAPAHRGRPTAAGGDRRADVAHHEPAGFVLSPGDGTGDSCRRGPD